MGAYIADGRFFHMHTTPSKPRSFHIDVCNIAYDDKFYTFGHAASSTYGLKTHIIVREAREATNT